MKEKKFKRLRKLKTKIFLVFMLFAVIGYFTFLGTSFYTENVHKSAKLNLDITGMWLKGFIGDIKIYEMNGSQYSFVEFIPVNNETQTNMTTQHLFSSGEKVMINTTRYMFPDMPITKWYYNFTVPTYNFAITGTQIFLSLFGVQPQFTIPSVHNITDVNGWQVENY